MTPQLLPFPTLHFAGSWLILLHNDSSTAIVFSPSLQLLLSGRVQILIMTCSNFCSGLLTGHCASCLAFLYANLPHCQHSLHSTDLSMFLMPVVVLII